MAELTVQERAMGAVIGSLVADAAGQPLHWIYDVKRLDQVLKGREATPEFVDPGQGPFYRQPTGAQSGYGDQTLALLKALVAGKGFNVHLYRQELYKTFGPNSEYDLKGKPKGQDQVQTGGYRHASIKAFLTAYEAGKEKTGISTDAQMDGVAKIAPVVALYAGDPKLAQYVEEAVRVTQDDNLAVQCSIAAAAILEEFILHPPREAFLEQMRDRLELSVITSRLPEILQRRSVAHREMVQQIGSSCAIPGNLLNSLHCLLASPSLTDYPDTIRQTLTAGGCNCSRLSFVGACVGAAVGPRGLPGDWIKKTRHCDLIEKLSQDLVALRVSG
ncbi:selenoprotein J [Stegostoma tigrinum]|uniref:selenoprotein J n=1 Tax=Stegostoma tigrinum TaxID=3053191 RepID=UPI00202AE08E|nr:selenoprotein J [Stegostoma tigrinum]XP_059502882.1 selenoprotein J [Stegostoma tigrinum]